MKTALEKKKEAFKRWKCKKCLHYPNCSALKLRTTNTIIDINAKKCYAYMDKKLIR